MKKSIRSISFVYFILIHWFVNAHHHKNQLKKENIFQPYSYIDCSIFPNDEYVIGNMTFDIPLNLRTNKNQKTHGSMDTDGNIYIEIINENSIPIQFFCLKHLKRLIVQNTCFYPCNYRIPSKIQHFASSLIELHISNTKIIHLPKQIGKLKNLETLEITNTGLKHLPYTIGKLSSLRFLSLSDNQLKNLPDSLSNLRLLRQITLSNNPDLHSIQPIHGLYFLETLDVRWCSIKYLPRNLPNLIDLYMSKNKLTIISDIETLGYEAQRGISFYFDSNRIRSISPKIDHIKNLTLLNLDDNLLKTLPSNIFNIKILRDLYIDKNCFDNNDDDTVELKKELIKKFNVSFKTTSKLCYTINQ